MLNIVSQIQAALEKASPIRKLSDADLNREIATLRKLQEILEPKQSAPTAKAQIAPRLAAPIPSAAAKRSLPQSLPLSKGSIYSKRPAAVRPIVLEAAPVIAVAVSEHAIAPAADVLAVPMDLRRQLKLRLQLCEAERCGRERRSNRGCKSIQAVRQSADRGQPKARKHKWSCANDVLLDVPAMLACGEGHAKPNSSGNWVRLPIPAK